MATERQYSANRLNALRSTGPNTPEGKAASSMNAVKHGLTSESVLLVGEDGAAFEDLYAKLIHYYEPKGVVAQELCRRATQLMWRLRRVASFEAALMTWVRHDQIARENRKSAMNIFDVEPDHDLSTSSEGPHGDHAGERLATGRMIEEILKSGDVLSKLQRYETATYRLLMQTLAELDRLYHARLEEETMTSSRSEGLSVVRD